MVVFFLWTKAFLAAWAAACEQGGGSKMLIPNGTFFLNPVDFSGPCNGSVAVQLEGTVAAPPDLRSFPSGRDEWIAFNHVDRLHLAGGGTFDGRGGATWDCVRAKNCPRKPPRVITNQKRFLPWFLPPGR